MVQLADGMLALDKQLSVARSLHHKTALHGQTDATDRQIDRPVYEPHGLTDEEMQLWRRRPSSDNE
jgi:hypothetical protein